MGYLGVLTLVFVAGLIINAMFFGLISMMTMGRVGDWVLLVSFAVAGLAAELSARQYERSTSGAGR